MPELPEVQTIVNDLQRKIVGSKIVDVWYNWARHIKYPSPEKFKRAIKNSKILKVERRAKNILIHLDKNRLLLIHLKMTGHLLLKRKNKTEKDKHIHLIFYLDDGRTLLFSDIRKFGKVLFGEKEQVFRKAGIDKLGPEPLASNFSLKKFQEIISGRKGKIKTVLMNQNIISGIGNIYSDEVLWLSKISPFRTVSKLSVQEVKNLYRAIQKVLKKAIKLRGSSISDYRDISNKPGTYSAKRLVYKREDEPCPRCGSKIKKARIGGRSTHFCPNCQK